jgi:hypothetical protein
MEFSMIEIKSSCYGQVKEILSQNKKITFVHLTDHINGFDENYNSIILNELNEFAKKINKKIKISYHQILPAVVKNNYKNLDIVFDAQAQERLNLKHFSLHSIDSNHKIFKDSFCCFLGCSHVSGQFLSAILNKTKLWNNTSCSKNFSYDWETLDGNITTYVPDNSRYFRKFFIDNSEFNKKINSLSTYKHGDTVNNLYKLKNILNSSFVNVVSETLGTSYVPFITEKFLQSIVVKGLFVTYGQPSWHEHLKKYYGFKLYNKIFDYDFDQVDNPIIRVVKLIEMISKFQNLSTSDRHDLYLIEKDTVEYNYDHYYSKNYLKYLEKNV